MSWTVRIEDEEGNIRKSLSNEFILSDQEIIFNNPFRLIKYLDPYGDTTFNSLMFEDLKKDFAELQELSPADKEQSQEILDLVKECEEDIHLYLKFYGD